MRNKILPKVSIIIPVYNGSKYVKEAIDSSLAQTYKNIEIVVVNDGSNDNKKTDKIILSYGNKIKYFKKENGGVSTALNMAIKNSSGKYISWLSHDDVYYSNKIEKQVEYLIKTNSLNKNLILYSDYDLIDEKSNLISKCIKNHQLLIEKPEYALLRGNINGITLLIPKKAFKDCGLFNEDLKCTQDYELWMRMEKKYKFEHMDNILAKSRYHREQVSNTNPKVITEGNKLWTEIVKSYSTETMIRLEGSEYNFYKEMAKFLIESPYEESCIFCKNKCKDLEKQILIEVPKKLVSVIIPFYNRINLLKKSVKSVLNQTHKNLEIILVNDGSSENINSIKQMAESDERIKIINLEKNYGAANARNVGIDNAKGEYISFLDSDDIFIRNKIEKQLFYTLLTNSNISHTSYLRKGFNEKKIVHSGTLNGKVIPTIIYSCSVATPTVMIKTSYLNDNNFRYNPQLMIGEDTCFWLEILRNQSLLGIDEDLTIVNVGKDSAAYNVEKQIIGIKTILTYVLNDSQYNRYDKEIALLCNSYVNYINELNHNVVTNYNLICPNCDLILNSKSWKITKPLRLISKTRKSIKEHGLKITIAKIKKNLKIK